MPTYVYNVKALKLFFFLGHWCKHIFMLFIFFILVAETIRYKYYYVIIKKINIFPMLIMCKNMLLLQPEASRNSSKKIIKNIFFRKISRQFYNIYIIIIKKVFKTIFNYIWTWIQFMFWFLFIVCKSMLMVFLLKFLSYFDEFIIFL